MSTDPPKYPNQQLRSVSLEAYFPGRLGTYGRLGDIQESVENRLPNLFVPNSVPGEPTALRPFQLRDDAQQRSLAVAVNQVAYVSFKYPGFAAFKTEAVPLVADVLRIVGAEKLNRLIYRYENELGLDGDDDAIRAALAAFPGVGSGMLADGQPRRVDANYEYTWADDHYRGARGFHARTEVDAGMTVFRLTVFASVEACDIEQLEPTAEAAHHVGSTLFESLISESFREFISRDGGD